MLTIQLSVFPLANEKMHNAVKHACYREQYLLIFFEIKLINAKDWSSISLVELLSFASSNKASEYLLTDVPEKSLVLLNLFPLLVFEELIKI